MDHSTVVEILSLVEQYGWAVFPCKANKRPFTEHGFHDASRDPAKIQAWAEQYPECLWGMPTGAASGLFVLDIDVDPVKGIDGREALDALTAKIGALPETVEAITPRGGRHIYFSQAPGEVTRCSTGELGPGLDTRGDGGYVCIPPSRANGRGYVWEASSEPGEAPFAVIPPALLALVRGGRRDDGPKAQPKSTEIIGEGQRNAKLTSIAGRIRRAGMSESEMRAALEAINAARCKPPLPAADIAGIAHSVSRYAPGQDRREPDFDAPAPDGESATALMESEMAPITYHCDPWAPEGLCIDAGRPKIGKTTLLRQKAAAIASGNSFLGAATKCTPVVFLSLEEGRRLMRKKLQMAGFDQGALDNITIHYEWPRGKAGVLQILRVLDAHPDRLYWVIDSLSRFREMPDARTPAFMADYNAVNELHEVTNATPGLCIDVIHHTRKAKSEDPIDDVSGTYGLTAACDAWVVLRHHEDGAILHAGGRLWDKEATQFQLRRGKQRWELVGEFDGLTTVQQGTLYELKKSGGLTSGDAAKRWGISRQAAAKRLDQLIEHNVAYYSKGIYYAK